MIRYRTEVKNIIGPYKFDAITKFVQPSTASEENFSWEWQRMDKKRTSGDRALYVQGRGKVAKENSSRWGVGDRSSGSLGPLRGATQSSFHFDFFRLRCNKTVLGG